MNSIVTSHILKAMIASMGRDKCLETNGKLMLPDKIGFMMELMRNVCGLDFDLKKWKGKTIIYEDHEIKVLHLTFIQWFLENVFVSALEIDRFDCKYEETNETNITVCVDIKSVPIYYTRYMHTCRNLSPLVENNA